MLVVGSVCTVVLGLCERIEKIAKLRKAIAQKRKEQLELLKSGS